MGSNKTLRRALLLSLGLHLALALFLFVAPRFQSSTPPAQAVTVELISEPTAAEKILPKQPDLVKTKQIVEQDKSINDEKPTKEAYLSAHDQAVQKQTVAQEHGEFRNAKAVHSVAASKASGHKQSEAKPQQQAILRDLMGTSPIAMLKRQEERDRQSGEGGTGARAGADASRTSDYVKDADKSNETMLNTREFRYYTYYQRIRRQLSQYWEPRVHDKLTKMFQQGRRIASDQDHVTKLLIVLNDHGVLVKVQVLSESGVADLDDAATDAFKDAAPFPNPPKGIVEQDGTVKIRWDFVLES